MMQIVNNDVKRCLPIYYQGGLQEKDWDGKISNVRNKIQNESDGYAALKLHPS